MATSELPYERLMREMLAEPSEQPWTEAGDLGRMSVEAFLERRGDARELRSQGRVRLSGAGVLGHAADLDDVGQIATLWQRCLSAVGASLEGSRSALGRMSSDVVQRTQMLLNASPAPGSVVLRLVPKAAPMLETYPTGRRSLFGDDPRPLADRASEGLLRLLQHASQPALNDLEQLSAEFEELGPRVATSVKMLAETLVRTQVDIDAEWTEPKEPTVRASVPVSSAGWISEFVAGRELDAEDLEIVGVVRTVSDIAKWAVEGQEGLEQVDASGLPAGDIRTTNVGDQIRLLVRVRVTERPDGTVKRVLTARELIQAETGEGVVGTSN